MIYLTDTYKCISCTFPYSAPGDSIQIYEVCNWWDGVAIRISCKQGSIIVIRSVTLGEYYYEVDHKCQRCTLPQRFPVIRANEHRCTEQESCVISDY